MTYLLCTKAVDESSWASYQCSHQIAIALLFVHAIRLYWPYEPTWTETSHMKTYQSEINPVIYCFHIPLSFKELKIKVSSCKWYVLDITTWQQWQQWQQHELFLQITMYMASLPQWKKLSWRLTAACTGHHDFATSSFKSLVNRESIVLHIHR